MLNEKKEQNRKETTGSARGCSLKELMLLLDCGMENAEMSEMMMKAKRDYVRSRHTRAISQMPNASGYKKDKWKTYIKENGKRKEILRDTEEEIYEELFKHYYALENREKTLSEVFDLLVIHKQDHLGRASSTISEDKRRFDFLGNRLKNMAITDITDEDIQAWAVKDFLPSEPREASLRKQFQLLGQIFDYGIKKKCCFENPMKYLSVRDYIKNCNLNKKSDEQRKFSDQQIEVLKKDAWEHCTNPRALMLIVASETGMRAGELPVLHKKDIEGDFIHVHRQQRKERNGSDPE